MANVIKDGYTVFVIFQKTGGDVGEMVEEVVIPVSITQGGLEDEEDWKMALQVARVRYAQWLQDQFGHIALEDRVAAAEEQAARSEGRIVGRVTVVAI